MASLPDGTPNPHKYFVLAEGNLGVPQKILGKAYLEATKFAKHARAALRTHAGSDELAIVHARGELSWASSVLLLLNPGHQTAWNIRKQLVSYGVLQRHRELEFTTALLTVRDCAKTSMLWHHRRWLLCRTFPSTPPALLPPSAQPSYAPGEEEELLKGLPIPVDALQREFAACTTACGTYERNYFAWLHRFRCFEVLYSKLYLCLAASDTSIMQGMINLVREEAAWTTHWIDRHVSDYTAMQYRCWIGKHMGQLRQNFTAPVVRTIMDPRATYTHARDLLKAFPDHEALWCYVKGAMIADELHLEFPVIDEMVKLSNYYQEEGEWESISQRQAVRLTAWLCRLVSSVIRTLWWRVFNSPSTPGSTGIGSPETTHSGRGSNRHIYTLQTKSHSKSRPSASSSRRYAGNVWDSIVTGFTRLFVPLVYANRSCASQSSSRTRFFAGGPTRDTGWTLTSRSTARRAATSGASLPSRASATRAPILGRNYGLYHCQQRHDTLCIADGPYTHGRFLR